MFKRIAAVFSTAILVGTLQLCTTQAVMAAPLLPQKVAIHGSVGEMNAQYTNTLDALGYDYDFISRATWGSKTAADFEQYSSFIVADFNRNTRATYLAPLVSNISEWAPLVDGNILVLPLDEGSHGRLKVIESGLEWVLSDRTRRSMYFSLSEFYETYSSPTAPTLTSPIAVDELSYFGSFEIVGGTGGACLDSVKVVADHQAVTYDGIADPSGYLSNWGCSVHSAFTTIPGDWTTLAISDTHSNDGAYQTFNLPGGGTIDGLSTIIAREVAPVPAPEPSTLILLTGGLALIPWMRRRRTRA